jgi:hypothetical protein
MACDAANPWRLSFSGWRPRPPEDERSPWAYLDGVTADSTFPTLDAALHALETAGGPGGPAGEDGDDGEDAIRPLFWPLRELDTTA